MLLMDLQWLSKSWAARKKLWDCIKKYFVQELMFWGLCTAVRGILVRLLVGAMRIRELYEDAVELYTVFLEKLREEEGGEDPEIMKYESLIEWNRERIQEREERTSEEEDETGEHDKSQKEGKNNEDNCHSRGEVEEVKEDKDVEESEEIAGAEGVWFEGCCLL
jgi:hypothetical protein